MTNTNPLDLPEIRDTLASYLSRDDLANCIRVCSAWHSSFHPILWASVEIGSEQDRHPFSEDLRKRRTLVRRLVYHVNIPNDHLSIHYPTLRTLHVHVKSNYDSTFDAIVKTHPSLVHLELHQQVTGKSVGWLFPDTLSNLSALRLVGVTLLLTNWDVFWSVCSRLETLHLQIVIMNATDPPETTWKMKDLSLVSVRRIRPSAQLELIRQCPELRRLHWSPRRGSFPKDKFVQSILGDTWIMLGDLCMDNTKVSDQELSTIIGGIRRITGLSVASTHFNIQSMTALRNHFHWLRRLNTADMLGIVDDTTCSEFTIQVLKSCPRLERLKAEGVSAEYLIDDGPWACERSLRILEVCFEILSDHVNHDSQQEAAMGRLMRFVNLERLDFSNGWYGQSIEFQLERGLEKLATLTALQELVLPSKMLRLSLDDVEWMIEHWRNLKSIEGSLVRNHDDPLNLVDRFSEAGISAPNLFVSLWQEGHN